MAKLKEGEDQKKKSYRCIVWIEKDTSSVDWKKITDNKDLELDQKTPIRVLHRRSNMNRKKLIHSITIQILNSHFLIVDLVTSAGTYVKEFIHGDLGRTRPSFSSLVSSAADILQLDVLDITSDFPTSTSNYYSSETTK